MITGESSKSSSMGKTGTKQVTLFDCCSAMSHTQVARRRQKEKCCHGMDKHDKSYKQTKTATASLNGGRSAKLNLSLRRKQPKEDRPVQQQPTSASIETGPIPLQIVESDSDGEQSLKHSKPVRRLQPMRAVKKLKAVCDQTVEDEGEEEGNDDEDFSYSACRSQSLPPKPKRVKSSPVIAVRSSIMRQRKISISSRNGDGEDCEGAEAPTKGASPRHGQPEPAIRSEFDEEDEDFESSPKCSSPLHKLPRRALKKIDDVAEDEVFESSPKYSDLLRKRQRQAVKRLKFGAELGNGAEVAGESLCNPLPVPELDDGILGGHSMRGTSVSMEHVVSLKGVETDSSARRDGGRSSASIGTNFPSQSPSAILAQSSVEMEYPLSLPNHPSAREQPVATGPVQLTAGQSQCYLSGHQSSNDLKVESTDDSFQQLLAGEVHVHVLNHTVEYLEKQRRYKEACALLQFLLAQSKHGCSSRGQWFDRLALNLDFHLKKQKEVSSRLCGSWGGGADGVWKCM